MPWLTLHPASHCQNMPTLLIRFLDTLGLEREATADDAPIFAWMHRGTEALLRGSHDFSFAVR